MAMMEAALAYYDAGYLPIPITPGAKAPALLAWGPLVKRRPSREEVEGWWRRWPTANIALLTGPAGGIDVIDVDTKTKGDPAPFQGHGAVVARTPSGGHHFYWKESGLKTRVGARQGVDVRAAGGYVLAPPSVIKGVGGYRFEDQPLTDADLLKVPPKVARLVRSEDQKAPSGRQEPEPRPSESWIAGTLADGVSEGNRNQSVARLAGYLLSKGLPRDVVIATLDAWNVRNDPPLEYEELARTVSSIAATEAKRTDLAVKETEELVVYSFNAFMERYEGEHTSWIIDGWLPAGSIAMIQAAPRSYKTWMALDLALSVATGQPFLGIYPVERPGPVYLVQEEDPPGGIAARLGPLACAKYYDAPADFYDFPDPAMDLSVSAGFSFESEAMWHNLIRYLEATHPRMVLLDPLYAIARGDDWFAGAAKHLGRLKRLRNNYGTSFVILHHTRKPKESTTGKNPLAEHYGSQLLQAATETVWAVNRPDDGKPEVIISRHFKVSEDVGPRKFTFDIDRELERVPVMRVVESDPDPVGADDNLSERERAILTRLDTVPDAPVYRDDAGSLGMTKGQFSWAIKSLTEKGLLVGSTKDGWVRTMIDPQEVL